MGGTARENAGYLGEVSSVIYLPFPEWRGEERTTKKIYTSTLTSETFNPIYSAQPLSPVGLWGGALDEWRGVGVGDLGMDPDGGTMAPVP